MAPGTEIDSLVQDRHAHWVALSLGCQEFQFHHPKQKGRCWAALPLGRKPWDHAVGRDISVTMHWT